MKILINGVHLYFDVEGLALRPEGGAMVEKPNLILLHGGPGADHTLYKPAFSALTDIAQVIYLDHCGNGRSDSGPEADWTLKQWADDVHGFCVALGIDKPIVYGASFGGMVAMAYAIRHARHAGKLVLVSTTAQACSHTAAKVAMFAQLGGPAAGELAHRRFVLGDTGAEVLREWIRVALPLYTQCVPEPLAWHRQVFNERVRERFFGPGGEGRAFDMLANVGKITCKTLILGGQLDPMIPVECQRDIAAAIRQELVEFHEFANCGHGVVADEPEAFMAVLRRFIQCAQGHA